MASDDPFLLENWRIALALIGKFVILISSSSSSAVFISAALAVGSGVGGGTFFLVVYILILGLDVHYTIPLSKATIFGVAVAAFRGELQQKASRRRTPSAHRL